MRSIEQAVRWGWPLAALALAGVASAFGATFERALLGLALAALVGGAVSARHRNRLAHGALALLAAATLVLVLHLARDDFGYRYVWLSSAPEVPLHLKVASLWGGEEGTLLLLATLLALAACRLVAWDGWSGPGALLLGGA